MRNLDIDLEHCNALAAIHGDPYLITVHFDVLCDHGHDLVPQNGKQVELTAAGSFIGEQDLQPLPRNGCATAATEPAKKAHAALRPSSRSRRLLRSLGMLIGTSWPLSLRAASV